MRERISRACCELRTNASISAEIETTARSRALLTLSTKYDFKHIRAGVITQVSRYYPMTLVGYDEERVLDGHTREQCSAALLKAAWIAHATIFVAVPLLRLR